MTQKKKKLALISLFAAILAVTTCMSVSIAYLGQTKNIKNTMKVGHGDLEIFETFSPPSEVSMISEVEKKFNVRNTGTVPGFARIYAEFSDSEVASRASVKLGNEWYTWDAFKKALSEEGTSEPEQYLKQPVTKWRYVKTGELSGYFYYSGLLQPGDSTEDLFDSVKVDFVKYDAQSSVIDNSNIDRIVDYEMIVYSEIVQNTETGLYVSGTTSEYGYEYKDGSTDPNNNVWHDGEWKEAWMSFLKVSS